MSTTDSKDYKQLVIENNNDAICVFNNLSGKFSFVNNAVYALLGYLPEEMESKTLQEILTRKSFLKVSRLLKEKISVYESGNQPVRISTLEIEQICKDGKIISTEFIITLIPGEYGKIEEILCVSRDISARKAYQQQLLEKDQKLLQQNREYLSLNKEYLLLIEELEDKNRYIVKYSEKLAKSVEEKLSILARLNEAQRTANIGSWEWNIQSGNVWWSEQLFRIFEVDSGEYVPAPEENVKFVHPADRERYNITSSNCIATGELLDFDFRIVTHKGETKFCNATGKVFYDTDGKPTRFTGTLMDITSRKTAEESFRKLYHAIEYIITETSQKIGSEYFNALVMALCETLEADYAHISILQPDRQFVKTIALCYKQQILPDIEYKLRGTPCETVVGNLTCTYQKGVASLFPEEKVFKELHVEGYIGVPLYYKTGNPLGLIVCLFKRPIEDSMISETIIKLFIDRAVNEYERLKDKEQLVLAREKAEESDRLKTMFLQNMSHEIRTPMNAIVGFAELLTENFNNKNKISQFSQIIQQRSKDLLELINDILDLSRIESGKHSINFGICDLNLLFDELNDMFQIYKRKKEKNAIRLVFYPICDPEKSVIITDKVKLRQIFINLINNAFKFTNEGKIEVGCTFSSNAEMQFYVADTGKGIPDDKQKLIFSRFMQLNNASDNPQGGTGLGLAIVKGLVELLGGHIWVKSKVGEGSRFTFSFTYKPTLEKESPATASGLIDLSRFSQKNVLIVEDDIYSAEYIMELLSESGLAVDHVVSGTEAIHFVENKPVDIVLLDIRLPEIDGYEITRRLKKRWPQIKVVAQTAYAMQEDRQKALEAGCDDYVSKPVDKNLLFSIIYTQLSR